MNAGDKQVRFTFAVDQRSLGAAKQAIASLTSEVKKLVETTARAGQSMSMLGGGGGFLGGVSGKAGGINPSQQATLKGGSILTQGIAGDARALAGVAKASNDALRQMTSGMRSSVNEQKSVLMDLRREIQQVERALKGLGSAGDDSLGELSAVHGGRGALQNRLVSLNRQAAQTGARDNAWATGGFLHRPSEFGPGDWDQYRPAAGPGRRGAFGRMSDWATDRFEGSGLGKMAGGLGIGAGAGTFGAALAALTYTLSHTNRVEQANFNNGLDLPMRYGRIGARIGNSAGGLGMAIRGGDLASSMAMEGFARGKHHGGFYGLTGALSDDRRLAVIDEKAGLTNTVGNWMSGFGNFVGTGFANVKEQIKKDMGWKITHRHSDPKINAAIALQDGMNADKTEEMAEMVRNEIASKPQLASMYNAAYASGFGNIGTARTGGLRLGVNQRTGNTYMAEFNARALGAGYDPGAVAGARAQLGSIAGRGLMGAGQYMLGLQAGGLGNSDMLYGVGAQFGGGGRRGAQAFLNAVQGGIGGGGVDVTAGSQIAGLVAGGMSGGGFMGASGTSLMQGMLSAGYTGTPGGDMARARMLQGGMGEYGRNLAGATDPLQMGINTLAANASGAKGWYAKRALMNMDPTQMLEAMRSGKLPGHLADQGLGMGDLQRYNSFRNQYAFSRYIDAEGAGTAQGAAVAGVKAAGGVGNYLHQLLGKTGAGTKAGRGIINQALTQLGTARMATQGGSLENNIGALAVEIAGDSSLTPALRGRGAGGPRIKGTIEGSVAEQEAKKAKEQGEFEAQRYDKIKGAVSRMVDNSNAMAGLTKDLVENTKTFDQALGALTTSIMNSLQRLAPSEYARLQKEALDNAKKKAGAIKGK